MNKNSTNEKDREGTEPVVVIDGSVITIRSDIVRKRGMKVRFIDHGGEFEAPCTDNLIPVVTHVYTETFEGYATDEEYQVQHFRTREEAEEFIRRSAEIEMMDDKGYDVTSELIREDHDRAVVLSTGENTGTRYYSEFSVGVNINNVCFADRPGRTVDKEE